MANHRQADRVLAVNSCVTANALCGAIPCQILLDTAEAAPRQ
jgi:hypothetical protein